MKLTYIFFSHQWTMSQFVNLMIILKFFFVPQSYLQFFFRGVLFKVDISNCLKQT